MSTANYQTVHPPTLESAHSTYRILLIEDRGVIRQLGAQALIRAGYEVDAVIDAQSGWEALQAHHYDLLIIDNQMSGLSGLELVQELRSAKMPLPVILASGGTLNLIAGGTDELQNHGWPQSAATLPKPFTADQLLETVAKVLPVSAHVPYFSPIHFPASSKTFRHTESSRHWGINE